LNSKEEGRGPQEKRMGRGSLREEGGTTEEDGGGGLKEEGGDHRRRGWEGTLH